MDWNTFWNSIVDFFNNHGLSILWGVLTLILGWIIVKICLRITQKCLSKTKLSQTIQGFINSILKVILYVVLIMIVLQAFGIPITGLATMLATAGVAISLALKDSLSNVASGMILITTKPFEKGDYVVIGSGKEGTVKKIDIMSTQIVTPDNKLITLPNNLVLNNAMVNFSGEGKRRIDMFFEVAYNNDLNKVRQIAMDVCHSNGKIMLDPAPELHLREYKDNNLSLFLTCWTSAPYWEIYYYIMENMFNEFAKNDIKIDYNQVEVRMRTDNVSIPYNKKALPKRVEIEKPTEHDTFNMFDIESYKNLQTKNKQKHIKNLEKKRQKLDKQLAKLKATQPLAHKDMLVTNKSVMIKNKKKVVKITKKTKFSNKKSVTKAEINENN